MKMVLLKMAVGYMIFRQLNKLSDPEITAIGLPLVIGSALLWMAREPSFLEKVYKAVT